MGDTAATLFDTDRGQQHRIGDANLPGLFALAHNHETSGTDTPIIFSNANAADSDAADSLIANPWVQSLKQRVFEKIQNNGWGEGIDFLMQRLDGRDFEEVEQVLLDFQHECSQRGYEEAAAHIGSLLAYAELGLDADFFNTSENSAGGVAEPDVDINRYRIESHFANERHKPEQHVQPFLGISYG